MSGFRDGAGKLVGESLIHDETERWLVLGSGGLKFLLSSKEINERPFRVVWWGNNVLTRKNGGLGGKYLFCFTSCTGSFEQFEMGRHDQIHWSTAA